VVAQIPFSIVFQAACISLNLDQAEPTKSVIFFFNSAGFFDVLITVLNVFHSSFVSIHDTSLENN